jgi:hypothetical protein
MNDDQPNPGSDEAQGKGCLCPVMDNHHGAGFPSSNGPLFWINSSCELHGEPAPSLKSTQETTT